jgi:hypothetical protein
MKKYGNIAAAIGVALSIIFSGGLSMASVATVQEEEPRYKYTTLPSEKLFIAKSSSVSNLVSNVTAGVTQGVDSNPLLDSTHKADSYTQEMVDMHFKYPLYHSGLGQANSKFGFNINNINYYRINDVNIFDAVIDANIEQEISDMLVLNAGYAFEMMWFPHDDNGTYAGNQINAGVRQNITRWLYQKFTYRLLFKNFTANKVVLGTKVTSSELRADLRNVFEHELGIYIGRDTKVKIINQFYLNDSNYVYGDYYDYFNYKTGGSIIYFFTKNLYGIGVLLPEAQL